MSGRKSSSAGHFESKKSFIAKPIKRSCIVWNRFNLKVISSESKEKIFMKITLAVKAGAKLGRDLIVGSNSISRLIERNHAAVIAICRDSNHTVTDHIVEAARLKHIPVIILPKCIEELALLLSLNRVNCFAISIDLGGTRNSEITKCPVEAVMLGPDKIVTEDNNDEAMAEDSEYEKKKEEVAKAMVLSAVLDDLRDALMSLVQI
jgi:ribosomal protein L7Ae-like RNA K-turn-binding protein